MDEDVLEAESGWIDRGFAGEFPTLAMRYAIAEARDHRSSEAMRSRLGAQSTRFTGEPALELPRHEIPLAYRALFRQLGMNPDSRPTPVEAISRERVLHGSFRTHGVIADAVLVATLESHLALSVIDAARLDGPLGIRPVRAEDAGQLPAGEFAVGSMVVADAAGPVAQLFGPPAEAHAVSARTRRVAVIAVGVPGMDPWILDDGLWRVIDLIRAG